MAEYELTQQDKSLFKLLAQPDGVGIYPDTTDDMELQRLIMKGREISHMAEQDRTENNTEALRQEAQRRIILLGQVLNRLYGSLDKSKTDENGFPSEEFRKFFEDSRTLRIGLVRFASALTDRELPKQQQTDTEQVMRLAREQFERRPTWRRSRS